MTFGHHDFTPAELAEQLEADRRGQSYLLYRERGIRQRLLVLEGARVAVGRAAGNELELDWDPEVSRVHALLERISGRWTIVDDGLSSNGTFVNGRRVHGRRRLTDRDVVRVGRTELLFRATADSPDKTPLATDPARLAGLTEAQRRVLSALCRPLTEGAGLPVAASNREIAHELSLSVEAVRTHLKALFLLFEVPELPPNRKRAELTRRAVASGILSRIEP
jgi:pSer/pThr/pTyr-binding forkhead associated (FHA) protein